MTRPLGLKGIKRWIVLAAEKNMTVEPHRPGLKSWLFLLLFVSSWLSCLTAGLSFHICKIGIIIISITWVYCKNQEEQFIESA